MDTKKICYNGEIYEMGNFVKDSTKNCIYLFIDGDPKDNRVVLLAEYSSVVITRFEAIRKVTEEELKDPKTFENNYTLSSFFKHYHFLKKNQKHEKLNQDKKPKKEDLYKEHLEKLKEIEKKLAGEKENSEDYSGFFENFEKKFFNKEEPKEEDSSDKRLSGFILLCNTSKVFKENGEKIINVRVGKESIYDIENKRFKNNPVEEIYFKTSLIRTISRNESRPKNIDIVYDANELYSLIFPTEAQANLFFKTLMDSKDYNRKEHENDQVLLCYES